MESEHVSTALLLLCYRMDDYSLHCDRLLFLYYIDYVKYVASKLFIKCKIFFMLTSFSNLSPSSPSGTLSFFLFFLFFLMFDPILYIYCPPACHCPQYLGCYATCGRSISNGRNPRFFSIFSSIFCFIIIIKYLITFFFNFFCTPTFRF